MQPSNPKRLLWDPKIDDWVPIRNLPYGLAKRYDCFQADPTGTEIVHKKSCRRIKASEVADCGEHSDILIVRQVAVRESVQPKVKFYNDELMGVELEEEVHKLKVFVYCPKIVELKSDSVKDRIEEMSGAINSAKKLGADVFLGPEYFFCHNTNLLCAKEGNSKPSNPFSKPVAYSEDEKEEVRAFVRKKASEVGGMLIMPGTCLWKNDKRQLSNTAFIHCQGQKLAFSHDKCLSANDELFAGWEDCEWTSGSTTFLDFKYKDLDCRFQICADAGGEGDGQDAKELRFVTKFALAGFEPRAHCGGYEIHSDGDGVPTCTQPKQLKDGACRSADIPPYETQQPDESTSSYFAEIEVQKAKQGTQNSNN